MWFTETPWPPFAICVVIAAILFGRWMMVRRTGLLLAAGVFLVLGSAVVVVESLIVTDAERVEAGVYDLAKAFESRDVERCLEFFSANDQADRDLLRRAARLATIDGPIRISDLSVALSSARSRATSRFRASADVSFQGHHDRARTHWELTWQREGNDWKVVHVRRLSLLGENEVGAFSIAE
jgi:hypothetical protein